MKQNVGGIDKILRIIIGIALIIYVLYSGALWAWIGIVPLLPGSVFTLFRVWVF